MTREEIKNTSELVEFMLDESITAVSREILRKRLDAVCNLAIKALDQEPVLDKIREQIKSHLRGVEITLEVLVENDPLRPKMEGAKDTLEECLELIDKAETENKE